MPRFGLALFACLLFGPAAFACRVPVFRYAPERWQPSKDALVIYHRGPLSPTDFQAVRRFEIAARRANAHVTDADLAGQPGSDAAEVDPAPHERPRRSPLLRLGTVGAGLLVPTPGFWALGRQRPERPAG